MSNMVIRTNIYSMQAHRNKKNVGLEQRRSANRLSSGFRVNSAADDAAGLSISETMRAQIRGLDQAGRNAQDGQAMLQTAEGAMGTITDKLIRIRELIVQAANDTYVHIEGGVSNRVMIQEEIDQLLSEINSVARRTEFNSMPLLDGSMDNFRLIITPPGFNGSFPNTWDSLHLADFFNNTWWHTPAAADFFVDHWDFLVSEFDGPGPPVSSFVDWLRTTFPNEENDGERFRQAIIARDANDNHLHTWLWNAMDFWVEPYRHHPNPPHTPDPDACTDFMMYIRVHLQPFDLSPSPGPNEVSVVRDGSDMIWFQLGANSAQGIATSIGGMTTAHLGSMLNPARDISEIIDVRHLSGIDITTQLYVIDQAIPYVTGERAKLGAVINRLNHTTRSLEISSENLQDSESRVRNADMAREMMSFVMTNTLAQAGALMLAQANALPNNLLQLLN